MGAVLPARAKSISFWHVASLVGVAWVVVSAAGAAHQQTTPARDLPSAGRDVEDALTPGTSHDWQIDLAPSEFVAIVVEPLAPAETDEWPSITVASPGGDVVFESAEPSIMPGIDRWARTVVSFVNDRAGMHRLRIAARASPARYRLWVWERHPAVADDRQRLAAYRTWRDGMRLFSNGAPESLRSAAAKFDDALNVLVSIKDEEGEATTLATTSAVWYGLSDATRGTAAAKGALEIWRRLGREREEAMALSDLGLLAYLAYDYPSARSYYDQALTKHRAAGDALSEARTLTRVGWLHYAGAELQQVIETSQQSLPLYRSHGDPGSESIALNDLGRAYLDLGEISLALDSLKQALVLRPPDRYPRGAANVLIRTGLVYLAVAEWQRALDVLQQARALAQQVHDPRSEIAALVNLGSAHTTFGDTQEGSRDLEAALTKARAIAFRSAEAYALLWLGVGASIDGNHEKSRDYLEQAIAIQTAIKDIRGQSTTTRQLAAAQLALGLPNDALTSINKSIEISPTAGGLIYSGALTLANVYAALGDPSRARKHYDEALERFRQIRARHAESLALISYGRFEAAHGRRAEARDLINQALTIRESLRGLIVDPDLRMSYGSTLLDPYRLYIDVLMDLSLDARDGGFPAEAFHVNERARARGLVEMLARSNVDIHQGVDQALVARERSLRWDLNRKAAIQTTLLAGKRDERRLATLEREIADLSRSWRETTTLIRQQSPAYAALTAPEPLTAADVSALLDADTVLLAFADGEKSTWLFAVTTAGLESFRLKATPEIIEESARNVHRLLTARQPVGGETAVARSRRVQRADAELAEQSRELSDLVLGPIGDKLAGPWRGRRLAIVSSGALEYVPFAALPLPRVSGISGPIVAAHEIVTLPSASSLALLRKATRAQAPRAVAVFADPVFAADDPRVRKTARGPETATPVATETARAALDRLPFSRAEASAVASQVPRSSLLEAMDFDATLALATSGRLNDYRIIHFATHGVIDTTRPELSGLALSLVDRDGRSRDGYLRLNTIYNLRLSADLVVLSACQTALGKEVAGEGLVGLTRGFMYAGARRVIASLWQVSDVATAELMKKFYVGMLQRRLPPAAALRRAQLEMARDERWSAPYYWAGFILQGDWQQ